MLHNNSCTKIALALLVLLLVGGTAIAQMIFFDGFEVGNTDQTPIVGWTQEAEIGTNEWTANTSLTTYNRTPRTGAWNAYLRWSNTRWMFKEVALTGGTPYGLSFYARQDATTGVNVMASYGTTGSAAGMTNPIIALTPVTSGDYQYFSGTFIPATSGTYYVGIRADLTVIPWYISIDDISLQVAVMPDSAPINLAFSNVTATSMDVSWDDNSTNETGFRVYRSTDGVNYSLVADTVSGTTGTTGATYTVTQTGLSPLTTYYFRIAAYAFGESPYLSGSQMTQGGTVSGIKYIYAGITNTDTFPDFTTAINDLNTNQVAAGGVTYKVQPGATFTEIVPPLTASGSPIASIVFTKDGAGVNPVVQRTDAGTIATTILGAQGDAVITIDGADYVTFDQIDIVTTDQGIEYGYYLRKASTDDACKNVTISNCNITMTKGTSAYVVGIYASNNDAASLTSSATGITVTSDGGRTENLLIFGCDIRNVFTGIIVRGNITFKDLNPIVGMSAQGNSITNYAGNATGTAYGVYLIYQIMPNVSYNYFNNTANGGSNFTTIGYGIMNSTTVNGGGTFMYNQFDLTANAGQLSGIYSTTGGTNPLIHSNNSIKLSATAGTGIVYFNYITGTYPSITVSNNTFMTNGIASTGSCYLITASTATNNVMIANNVTSGAFNRTAASGSFYGYYNLGSPTGGTETFLNNNFSNITLAGTSIFYGIYSNTAVAQNRVASGNVISNIIGGTGAFYGLYLLSTTSNQIYNNTVNNITAGTGVTYPLYFSGTNPVVYNNTIYTITSGGATFYGIWNAGTGITHCHKNKVYDLTGTSTSTALVLHGIHISTGTENNVYNNFVYDLKAPAGASVTSITGINYASATSTHFLNAYYNSVYLNATSTGANFGTSAFRATSATPTVNLVNNVFVNTSTANGTGFTVAHRRATAVLTTYAATSNNNCWYAGVPSATNLIFYDGTNVVQDLPTYQTWVAPRDAFSVTELPPFVNVTTPPYDLHISTTIPTRLESGARPIPGITTDIDGDTRVGSTDFPYGEIAPDIGADEFIGIPIDQIGPVITYTPLPYTGGFGNRTLTATITDLMSGVSIAPGNKPTLFFNKNRGTWYHDSLTAAPWTFAFDHSKFGGVTAGDTVFYYVQAYDSSNNVSRNPVTAPATPNIYVITQAPLSGNYTVGLAEFNRLTGRNISFEMTVRTEMREVEVFDITETPFTSQLDKNVNSQNTDASEIRTRTEWVKVEQIVWVPMENGKPYTGDLYVKKSERSDISFPDDIEGVYPTITAAVADLNLRGVSGPVNFLLVDATYPTETYPIIINVANEFKPTAANRVTIKPNTGITATISGASPSAQIFRILSGYITIDGSNAGTNSRNLTIENTSTTSPQVISIATGTTTPTVGVTVKNCIVINGTNASSAVVVGNLGYFNDITLQNNSVQKAYIGIYVNATLTAGNGSILITQNDLNTEGVNAVRLVGVYVQGCDGAMVTYNNIANLSATDASNITGVWFATATINSTIANNVIGPISSTTGGPRAIAVSSALANANITIFGNIINGMSTSSTGTAFGIYIFSTTTEVTVEKNQVSAIINTNTSGYNAIGIGLAVTVNDANILVANNFLWNIAGYGWSSTTTDNGYGINIYSGSGYKIYYNSINLATDQVSATSVPACLIINSAVTAPGALDIKNNIFSIPATVGTNRYAVLCNAANTVFSNIDHNLYFTSGPNLGYIGATNRIDLAAWRVGTGQDENSISANPDFVSMTDLHIQPTSFTVNRKATPIFGITDDIDGDARNPMFPDIGADEYTPDPPSAFTLINPANGAIAQPINGHLIWHASVLAQYYDVYLDEVNPPLMIVSPLQTDTTYAYDLMPNKTYYWKVVAHNDTNGMYPRKGSIASPVWSFHTEIWDIGATAIIRPMPISFEGNVITPRVKVKNFGNVQQSAFPVIMTIGTIYADTQTVANLLPGDSVMVDFDPWAAVLGVYGLKAWTTLQWDNNTMNDTATGSVEVLPPSNNVGTMAILSPD
ncbi:MAG: fibronectin type III domain-containing protein, partial [Candidatus Latescibacteria bacterium]|nr:fibronectin type III domain-containing protein [Candidatus Latescibacterota bacterium]